MHTVTIELDLFHGTDSEDFVILACVVLIGQQLVTDGRTDGRTDASATAKTGHLHSKLC